MLGGSELVGMQLWIVCGEIQVSAEEQRRDLQRLCGSRTCFGWIQGSEQGVDAHANQENHAQGHHAEEKKTPYRFRHCVHAHKKRPPFESLEEAQRVE